MDKLFLLICGTALCLCFLVTFTASLECFHCLASVKKEPNDRDNNNNRDYKCASNDRSALQDYLRECFPSETVCKVERYLSHNPLYNELHGQGGWRLRRSCSPPPSDAKYTSGTWHNVTKEGAASDTQVFYCNTDQCLAIIQKSSASTLSSISVLAVVGVLSKYTIV